MWIDGKIDSFTFTFSSLFTTADQYSICITANAAPILLSVSTLPSLIKKDLEILELFPEPEWELRPFFQWDKRLQTESIYSQPSLFIIRCKPPQCDLEVTNWWSYNNWIVCKQQRGYPEVTKPETLPFDDEQNDEQNLVDAWKKKKKLARSHTEKY